ncbi:MAG: phosphodiester glycosidase family protein [Bacteroidota bacterium]
MKVENYPLLALIGFMCMISLMWVGVSAISHTKGGEKPQVAPQLSNAPKLVAEKEKATSSLPPAMVNEFSTSLSNHTHLLPDHLALAQHLVWKEKAFDTYVLDSRVMNLSLHWKDNRGKPYKTFSNLEGQLESQNEQLLFAINGGMFTPQNKPMGLYIEEGRKRVDINLEDGLGNFFKKPNGVFYKGELGVSIVESSQFESLEEKIEFATQSGPILIYNGNIHPAFDPKSKNQYIRSAVGIISREEVVFAISTSPVNFFELATFFKEQFQCKMALYLDGAHSDMYLPELSRMDFNQNFGPIIAVSRPLK